MGVNALTTGKLFLTKLLEVSIGRDLGGCKGVKGARLIAPILFVLNGKIDSPTSFWVDAVATKKTLEEISQSATGKTKPRHEQNHATAKSCSERSIKK